MYYIIIWYDIHVYAFSWEMIQQISWLFRTRYTILQKNEDTILDGLSFLSSSKWCFFRGLFGKHIPDRMDIWKKTPVSWSFGISTIVNSSLVHDSCFFKDRCRRPQPICTEYNIYIYIFVNICNFIDVLFIVCVCVLCRLSRWHTFFCEMMKGLLRWFVSVRHRWKVVAFF